MNEENNAPVIEATPESDPILTALSDDEPTTVETKPEEVETTIEPAEQEATPTDEKEPETETTPEVEQPETPLDQEEAQKEEARRRYEERERSRAERRQKFTAEAEQVSQKHVDESIDEYDQRMRQIEANDTKREYQRYVENIEHVEDTLINEYERVKADPALQMFNLDNKEKFNAELFNYAKENFELGQVIADKDGNPIGLRGSLYQHLKKTAELYSGAIKAGQFQQVKAQRQMKTNADTKPAVTPKEAPKDPIMEVLMSD